MRWMTPITFAALAVCSMLAACAGPTSVDTVLDDAEQALGGPAALTTLDAVRITGHGTWAAPALGFPEMPYTSEVVYRVPDKLYWKVQPEMADPMMMGYDGEEAWGVWGGPPARHIGRMRKMVLQTVAEMQLMLVTPARGQEGTKFTLETPGPTGDPPVYRVTYRPGTGGEWLVAYDAETGHQSRLEHSYPYMMSDALVDGVAVRSDPRQFGTLTLPSVTELVGTLNGETYEVVRETVDSVQLNPEVDPDLFSLPERRLEPEAIGVKTVPPMTMVSIEHDAPIDQIGASVDRLMDGLTAAGLMSMGPVHCTYLGTPDPETGELAAQLAAPVMVAGEPPQLPEGFDLENWNATKVAYAYHVGDHASEGEAHERLQSWLQQEELTAAGPPRAVWYHNPTVTMTEDLVTEVQVPLD